MKAADCFGRNLKNFPKCVSTDVEVLELTYNRIRKVGKSDLSRFKYLTILYLTDNLISNLDGETFKDLPSLSALDLSLNALTKIPPTIFKLPALKSLYLSQNANMNIAHVVKEAKPISSPLTLLDISHMTDEGSTPPEFPDFGPLPLLATLNITRNQYVAMTPKHFAELCNLQIFVNINASVNYNDDCDCWIINNWLKERNVEFVPFRCPDRESSCLGRELSEEDKKVYKECRDMYDQILKNRRMAKIGLGVGITVGIVVVLACICFFWVRRKRRNQKKTKKVEETEPTPVDSLMLLNNQTKTFPPD